MQFRTRIFAVVLAGLSVPALATDANPPGPTGGPGASPGHRPPLSEAQRKALEGMTPEQRQQYFQQMR